MRNVIVSEWMTLDGVVQSPSGPGEDPDGDFIHGGWHAPHFGDPRLQERVTESIAGAGAYLLGRRTYQLFAAYWPTAPDTESAVRNPLNERPKYVASGTLEEPLPWQNSHVLRDNVPRAVAALKREKGNYLLVFGSTVLTRTLLEHNLVDEFRLVVDPVLVGRGKRIFEEDVTRRDLDLVESETTPSGAVAVTYRLKRRG